MIIKLDKTGTIEGFNDLVEEILENTKIQGLLIFSCDKNGFTPEKINDLLKNIPIPIFGGAFPSIIYNSEILERGTIIAGLSSKPNIQIVHDLSSNVINFDSVLEEILPKVKNANTMFVIVDGMASRVNSFLESLFYVFGLEFKYVGGGAGSLDLLMKPCLFTNGGLIQDSAIIALIDKKCGVGIKHGMHSVDGPFKITEARGNTVQTINWEPAAQFIEKLLKKYPEFSSSDNNFYAIAKHFALAINRLEAEKIVREPLNLKDSSDLKFSTEMKEGEFIDLVKTTPESSIKSANEAYLEAKKAYSSLNPVKTILCFECTARKQFLDLDFTKEINAIYDGSIPLIGVLTIGGEIGSNGMNYLEYYNRTCIVCVFED